ncbi:hypothetical protein F4X33_08710 [Candidatus Poribacteria bacterium]|nr:hypothetical protein [Candidatus Poribacteria bacterium]
MILIFSVILGSGFAKIRIDGKNVHVETSAYTVRFDKGVITYIHNKRTAETYTIPESPGIEGQTGILRWQQKPIPIWVRHGVVESTKTSHNSATMVFRQGGNKVILTIEIEPTTGDLLIAGSGEADSTGVYGLQWGCDNIDLNSVDLILPAHGGQVITASSPFESKRYSYPELWEAQLAIVQGEQGGFFVRGTDRTFQAKRFTYNKNREELVLGFETHNQAPFDTLNTVQSVVWRFNTYVGGYCVPAYIYRCWMEEAFEPWRLQDMPQWVQDIGLVIMAGVWNIYLDWLPQLAEQVEPSKTLLYLVGWRKDSYDQNYPDYTPREGFEDFLKTVKDLGYRVMLHTNLVGFSPYHPLYPEFQQYQFRSPWDNGNLIGWWWNEPDNPRRFAFINPASSQFRNLFVSRLKEIWETYPVDAFHLDISTVVENDANGLIDGLNAAQGNVLMHKELAEAMPGVVFSGEHLHEVTFFRESFAQRFPLPPELTPHPVSAFLFSPYTRPYGHLGIATAWEDPLRYQTFLDSYQSWGILPTLQGGDLEQPYHPLAQQVLDIARQWQDFGLRPDFESDWADDTLFQYVTHDGETVVYQKTAAGHTLLLQRSADLNQDGIINVLDLVFVANHFGTADGDINGDGQTNILDLVLVSQHFR